MSFFKALWSLIKAHPLGAVLVIGIVIPLLLGGIAVTVYNLAKTGIAAVSPDLAAKLPAKA